jgi:glucose-6-phosphate isomerase
MTSLWNKFTDSLLIIPDIGIKLDTSRMRYPESFLEKCIPHFNNALSQLVEIEKGEKVNIDEDRMVGHYWLRNPELAPDSKITSDIKNALTELKNFSEEIHSGFISGQGGKKFENILIIGIGGSALGPQLVSDALGTTQDKIKLYFCDNTDPDGIERVKSELEDSLDRTLCIVISKSGGTVETKNGMREFEAAYQKQGLEFGAHAVAITGKDSALDAYATEQSWCKQLYMWDWVGGRTSLFSQVGLLPAALQGIDIDSFIEGARIMDEETRSPDYQKKSCTYSFSHVVICNPMETEVKTWSYFLIKTDWYFSVNTSNSLSWNHLVKSLTAMGRKCFREFRSTETKVQLINMPIFSNYEMGFLISLQPSLRY